MGECCDNCRFGTARQYLQPDPLPEPVPRSAWFGLFRWQQLPTLAEQTRHDIQKLHADEYVPCMLRPKDRPVRKAHWCGEYQERPQP